MTPLLIPAPRSQERGQGSLCIMPRCRKLTHAAENLSERKRCNSLSFAFRPLVLQ